MSELEKEETVARIKGMSNDELKAIVELIPDKMLWDEMRRRYDLKTYKLREISKTMDIGGI